MSPEIGNIITEAKAVLHEEGSMGKADRGEALSTPSGSKARAGYQTESAGTGETQNVLHGEVSNNKPIDCKELQKTSWESDQLILAMKSRNGDGAKGLARKPLVRGYILRTQMRIKDGN